MYVMMIVLSLGGAISSRKRSAGIRSAYLAIATQAGRIILIEMSWPGPTVGHLGIAILVELLGQRWRWATDERITNIPSSLRPAG